MSSHTDPKNIPEPGEDVEFTMEKCNIWSWRKHGEDVWLRRGAESMIDDDRGLVLGGNAARIYGVSSRATEG